MNFVHKDVNITMDALGRFSATVQGVRVTKPSLPAMRKHIDGIAKVPFKPFIALTDCYPFSKKEKLVKVEVRRVVKNRARYATGELFVAFGTLRDGKTKGEHEIERIYQDRPQTHAAYKATLDVAKESRRIANRRDAVEAKADKFLATFEVPSSQYHVQKREKQS